MKRGKKISIPDPSAEISKLRKKFIYLQYAEALKNQNYNEFSTRLVALLDDLAKMRGPMFKNWEEIYLLAKQNRPHTRKIYSAKMNKKKINTNVNKKSKFSTM
jgi:hypothetical protein